MNSENKNILSALEIENRESSIFKKIHGWPKVLYCTICKEVFELDDVQEIATQHISSGTHNSPRDRVSTKVRAKKGASEDVIVFFQKLEGDASTFCLVCSSKVNSRAAQVEDHIATNKHKKAIEGVFSREDEIMRTHPNVFSELPIEEGDGPTVECLVCIKRPRPRLQPDKIKKDAKSMNGHLKAKRHLGILEQNNEPIEQLGMTAPHDFDPFYLKRMKYEREEMLKLVSKRFHFFSVAL